MPINPDRYCGAGTQLYVVECAYLNLVHYQLDGGFEINNECDDSLQTFSKTCSTIYSKISKKQYEYLQAMSVIQNDIFDSCNGLVKQQVDIGNRPYLFYYGKSLYEENYFPTVVKSD